MVHALKEAWRVMKLGGILIDQRPLSIYAPLDIVYEGKNDFVGDLDMSPGMEHDDAADHAIEIAIHEGMFAEVLSERFQVAYYWKDVRGMVADIHERWMDDVVYDENLIQHAYHQFRKHRPGARVRILIDMKLARHAKID